jgi:hypothetical protein
MSEVNQSDNSFDHESIQPNQSNGFEQQNDIVEIISQAVGENSSSSAESMLNSTTFGSNDPESENSESSTNKMNWQKVAHKLREYNRKLLKKVFRLEQELAEIDNKFNKYVEKSQNSDLLLAHQAEEIKKYQEKFALLTQQLVTSQQQVDNQELIIKQISEQHELSQKQTAQLERECTLLQENYSNKAFELAAKEQETQELQTKLIQQEQAGLQQEAELKRYQQAAASRKEKATSRQQNYPHNRFIQPWSHTIIPEPKIPLPKAKSQPAAVQNRETKATQTIKTAAEIATWSTAKKSDLSNQSKTAKSDQGKKPQSLAAVDLPTFPRPS